jgi:hypothetical protein
MIHRIPERYRGASLSQFTTGDIEGAIPTSATSVLITGVSGAGKTHLACALALSWGIETEFRSTAALIQRLKASWQKGNHETEQEILSKCFDARVLILDDVGAGKQDERALESVYLLIDHRYAEMMPTIVTTNMTGAAIQTTLGARVADRFRAYRQLFVTGKSRRREDSDASKPSVKPERMTAAGIPYSQAPQVKAWLALTVQERLDLNAWTKTRTYSHTLPRSVIESGNIETWQHVIVNLMDDWWATQRPTETDERRWANAL